MAFSEYNRDQRETLTLIGRYLKNQTSSRHDEIKKMIQPYLDFRTEVDDFQQKYLSDICTEKCFQGMQSACCNKEGIATFFADFVVNTLCSEESEHDRMEKLLLRGADGNKCVYLTNKGCLWRYKPIVCEMFLCDHAKTALKEKSEIYLAEWNQLREKEKRFTWPDKPVLFDELEDFFISEGIESPLMYFHKSPGLIRIKSRWKNV